MAHLALFRKYRSQDFDALCGQDHVTVTLRNALRMRRPGQAYLFCGPRGTGKTSTARIFAKALNCIGPDASNPLRESPDQPCNRCAPCERITSGTCLDVGEMDAASHTGVDNIREAIIGKADFAPVEARCKVYIVDEVHKLSSAAFAALLKTLEEPPPHLVFVLATTDPHEVPATIVSRCQRFDFRRIAPREMDARVRWICERERIVVEDDALAMIIEAADGSLRDALVILEQASAYADGIITPGVMTSLLGVTEKAALFHMTGCLLEGRAADALQLLDDLIRDGRDLLALARDLLGHVRALLIVRVSRNARGILKVSDDQVDRLEEQARDAEVGELMRMARILMELDQELKDPVHARLNWEVAIIRLTSERSGLARPGLEARQSQPAPALQTSNSTLPLRGGVEAQVTPAGGAPASTPAPDLFRSPVREVQIAEEATASLPSSHAPLGEPGSFGSPVPPGGGNLDPEPAVVSLQAFQDAWPRLLDEVRRERMMSLHAVLLEAKPHAVEGDCCVIAIGSKFQFHMQRIEGKRAELAVRLSKLLNRPLRLELRVLDTPVSAGLAAPAPAPARDVGDLKHAHDAFVRESVDLFNGRII